LFRSNDGGINWFHLDGHVPTVTQDVKVDPTNSNRIYATSLFDGRVNSRSGINVSGDGGVTWTHPATATPAAGFCETEIRRRELAAFRIAIDPTNAAHVFIGTNCGLAVSTDAGATWTFRDPTPGDTANDVNDVVVHHGGIIDLYGDDGHLRSTDGGATWSTASALPLPSGRCSIAASPDEAHVLFAVVGTSIFESDDGGQSWPINYANPSPQGRIPFVATNKRTGANYDLWFGDVSLFRGACTTPVAPPPRRRGRSRAAVPIRRMASEPCRRSEDGELARGAGAGLAQPGGDQSRSIAAVGPRGRIRVQGNQGQRCGRCVDDAGDHPRARHAHRRYSGPERAGEHRSVALVARRPRRTAEAIRARRRQHRRGALRVSRQFQPWLVGFGQVDVNESFISAHTVGAVTFGVSLGHWPRPSDFSNPVNPLGSLIPPVHYEVFDRVR
jgi:hypothetical protein